MITYIIIYFLNINCSHEIVNKSYYSFIHEQLIKIIYLGVSNM